MLFNNYCIMLGILGFSVLIFEFFIHWVLIASPIGDSVGQLVKILPPQMRAFLGEESLGFLSPLGMLSFGYTHPVLYVLFTTFPASMFNKEIAVSSEKGIIELTLGRPISRTSYSMTITLFFLSGLIFMSLCQAAGVFISLKSFPVGQSFETFLPIIVNFTCLFIFIGSMSLYFSVLSEHGSKALGSIIGFTLGLFFLEYLGRSIKSMNFTLFINPFHYYRPQTTLSSGEIPYLDMGLLLVGGIVLLVLSIIQFKKRDL